MISAPFCRLANLGRLTILVSRTFRSDSRVAKKLCSRTYSSVKRHSAEFRCDKRSASAAVAMVALPTGNTGRIPTFMITDLKK
jgi:hypothetical protein